MIYRRRSTVTTLFLAAPAALLATGLAASPPRPPENPAKISISVAPDAVKAGEVAEVTLRLEPIDGVKINRYPQIKLQVPARDGLVGESEALLGNTSPPPPGADKTANYFDEVEPLKLELSLAETAAAGPHEIDGKLTYYFCMPASGFCAPKRVPVKIPVAVR